jgi:acyl carrier protein
MTEPATTEAEIRAAIARALRDVAPEVDMSALAGDADLRDEAGLDSVDMVNFAIGLMEETGIDVPERDFPRLLTLDGCTSYLLGRPPP